MSGPMTFLDCPAYLDKNTGARCGLPAEVECEFVMDSTDGPLDSVMIRCPSGHFFNAPVEFLLFDSQASSVSVQPSRGSRHAASLPVRAAARTGQHRPVSRSREPGTHSRTAVSHYFRSSSADTPQSRA